MTMFFLRSFSLDEKEPKNQGQNDLQPSLLFLKSLLRKVAKDPLRRL